MCGIMKYWTSLRPNKTLPFLFLCVTVSCQQGKSYINHSLSLPIRKTYGSPCFCVFLVIWEAASFLDSLPQQWDKVNDLAAFCCGRVVPVHLCLSRSELQGHGLSFGKLCSLHSQYLREDDKSILPTGCKWCGSHTVWNALGNWSQSCLGLWKEARSLAFNWVVNGAPVKRKKTDSHVLCGLCHWVDGLLWFETAVNVIWMLQNSDWMKFQSLSGFSLQSYIKARRCEAGKESMDNNKCRNKGPNLSWQLLTYIMRYLVTCFQTSMQAVYKNLHRENSCSSSSEDSFLK